MCFAKARTKVDSDRSCSGCADAMTDILSYKANALRNFKRKKDRIDSRINLLGKTTSSDVIGPLD